MADKLKINDDVICTTGVRGKVIKIYKVTGVETQVMVVTTDNRQYHAPYPMWRKPGGSE